MTIPKIMIIEQVEYTVAVLRALKKKLGLADGTLKFEAMVETPQIILEANGKSLLPRLLDASDGRLRGVLIFQRSPDVYNVFGVGSQDFLP